ncbi:NAD(P)-binding domain-containing protein [Bacillus pacificus]
MNIGIIGAGFIGSTLAKQLVALGHQVNISNSRGPDTLARSQLLLERVQ